ncbi:MAG: class I SAM-dependent RNA methyltransferase, partial [Deltaproteobacteria bacterium]|nr:class I SAM-dependent RNA methyltransferase [Deltaproteobacteria bacterium]
MPVATAERGPLTVEQLVAGGEGLARLTDGRVAFVPGALPGDRIEPLEIEARRGNLRVPRFRLLEAGAERVAPACPEASRCGGCDWIALAPEAQLREKAQILAGLLERAGVR